MEKTNKNTESDNGKQLKVPTWAKPMVPRVGNWATWATSDDGSIGRIMSWGIAPWDMELVRADASWERECDSALGRDPH